MKKFFALILLLFTFNAIAFADTPSSTVDPYNTYRWDGKDKAPWFEWWYYKVVLPETGESFFFTYGVVNPWDYARTLPGSRATMMYGNFLAKELVVNDYAPTQFDAATDSTNVEVSWNKATDKKITGRLFKQNGSEVTWELEIERDWRFNAMGWAMSIPDITNIAWYPAQASATMTGYIQDGERFIEFNKAPAYQDRNWGRSFPKWWAWIVSNQFENSPGTVLAAGGGKPRVFNGGQLPGPEGLAIGLRHQGVEYAWRTNDADSIRMNINYGKWSVDARNLLGQRLVIEASAPKERFLCLPFTDPNGKTFYDYETLTGDMTVKLYKLNWLGTAWKLQADLTTRFAGLEYGAFEKVDETQGLDGLSLSLQY